MHITIPKETNLENAIDANSSRSDFTFARFTRTDETHGFLEATDSYIYARILVAHEGMPRELLIPGKALEASTKNTERHNEKTLVFEQGTVHGTLGEYTCTVPMKKGGALSFACYVPNDKNSSVKINNGMGHSFPPTGDLVAGDTKLRYSSETHVVSLDVDRLSKLTKAIGSSRVEILFEDNHCAVTIVPSDDAWSAKDKDGRGIVAIIMPRTPSGSYPKAKTAKKEEKAVAA